MSPPDSAPPSSSSPSIPKILFYDLDNTLPHPNPQPRSWSPATIRTLLALHHRKLLYTRVAVSYPDIAPLLESKGVSPIPNTKRVRWTLPAIGLIQHDDNTNATTAAAKGKGTEREETLMDSEPIAYRLEALVPPSAAHPALFPLSSEGETKRLLKRVEDVTDEAIDLVFKDVLPFVPDFLDDRGREYFHRTRTVFFGKGLEELAAEVDQGKVGERFRDAVEVIAAFYVEEREKVRKEGGEAGDGAEGFFLGGRTTPWYADFVVVACVEWWRCARGGELVDQALKEVEGGLLFKVFKGLEGSLYGSEV